MINEYKFNYRVACIIKNGDKILLHKSKKDDFYALPGGRVMIGEDSASTLKREFEEEMGAKIEVKNFLGLVGNFFEYNEKKYHELMLLFEAQFAENSQYYNMDKIVGLEENGKIEFIWKTRDEIEKLDVRPKFLKEKIVSSAEIGHIVNNML